MAEPITLTLNIGPSASITALGAAVEDVTRVLEFAATLQREVDRRTLLAQSYQRRISRYRDFPAIDPSGMLILPAWNPDGYQALDDFDLIAIREADENARITVQSLSYENPLEIVIFAGGAVVIAVLAMIRDWPDRRRLTRWWPATTRTSSSLANVFAIMLSTKSKPGNSPSLRKLSKLCSRMT